MALRANFYEFEWTPELESLEERAKGLVITTLTQAKHKIGIRLNLCEMATCGFKWTPELEALEERAKGIVITTLTQAKQTVGIRQNLCALAHAAAFAWADHRLSLSSIVTPIPITTETFLTDTIDNYWDLAKVFKYFIKYVGYSSDETSQYYYFEVIFSQPSAEYPIPQATASVFFRVQECLTEKEKAPKMVFRTEGHFSDHDVRFVAPAADMILAIIQKKLKFFKRLETLGLF